MNFYDHELLELNGLLYDHELHELNGLLYDHELHELNELYFTTIKRITRIMTEYWELLRPRITRIKRILPSACMRGQKIRVIRVIRGNLSIREIRAIRGSLNPCNPFNRGRFLIRAIRGRLNPCNPFNPWS